MVITSLIRAVKLACRSVRSARSSIIYLGVVVLPVSTSSKGTLIF
jgi:hypothetical protein